MNRGNTTRVRVALVGSVALIALSTGLALAQEASFAIPAQSLGQTLREISHKTGENILFRPETVSGRRAPAVSGKMSAQEATNHALAGSGLSAVPDGSGGLVITGTPPKNSLAASAEEAAQPDTAAETVVVTGSRIPQTIVTSASPIMVVGQEELKFEGTTDVTTLLNSMPGVFASQNSNVSNGATGTDNVNLRDLGPSRTLVLVNGSRLMPGDPQDTAADINVVPAALVDHIEIETGGASAVYGSDALAGVVNFILRKDFEGIELNGTYSIAQNDNDTSRWRDLTQAQIDLGSQGYAQSQKNSWNGQTEDLNLLLGVNSPDDKGNVSVYLGYRSVAAVLEQTRDYSECALLPAIQGDTCAGSSQYNRWFSFDNAYSGLPYQFFETGTGEPGSGRFTNFTETPSQLYNFTPTNYFQRPDTRYTGGFFAHYDVDKRLEVFANFMMADDSTVAQIAPSGLFFGTGTGPDFTVYVNCANPLMTAQENRLLCGELPGDNRVTVNGRTFYNGEGNGSTGNPFGVAGQANLFIARRDIEGGSRQYSLRHTSYRMQIGIRGNLDQNWSYNLYAQEGFTNFQQSSTGNFSASRVQNALQVDPATGQCYATEQGNAPSCVPLDIFNGIGSITPGMLKYVSANSLETGWTDEKIVSGSLTGDLGDWGVKSPWATDAANLAVGAEYRQENLAFLPDYEDQSGDIEGNTAIPAVPSAGFNVSEGFGEIQLPVIQNVLLIEDATLKGGYRYSSYSASGATNSWYAGADWQLSDDVRYRASLQRAVRAPNVLELFTPQISEGFVSNFPGSDPCATITTGQCAKVPNDGTLLLQCPAGECNEQAGGNAALKPETSTTRSVGIVLTPRFLDGFTTTIDWWNIDVSNYISVLPIQEILSGCYGRIATHQSEAYFCPFVHRTPQGLLYGNGYVSDDSINTGYLKTRGVDFQVNYQTNTADWLGRDEGTVSINLVGTWLDSLINEPVPTGPLTAATASQSAYNCAGLYGLVCGSPAPKWRHKLRLTWSSPFDVQFSLQWRFIGATKFDGDTSSTLLGGGPGFVPCPGTNFSVAGQQDCQDARISAYDYFDLSAIWQVRSGVELRAGVNNIFDLEPPILTEDALGNLSNGNTYVGVYDALGRTIFVSATIKY